jgi:hypothetical protein
MTTPGILMDVLGLWMIQGVMFRVLFVVFDQFGLQKNSKEF